MSDHNLRVLILLSSSMLAAYAFYGWHGIGAVAAVFFIAQLI